MSIFDFIPQLELNKWYVPLTAAGIILIIHYTVSDLNKSLFLGLALLFFAVAEIRSHREYYAPPNAYNNPKGNLTITERIPTKIGLLFYILSVLSFILFLATVLPEIL